MNNLIDLEIVSPVRSVYKGRVKSVSAPGIEGGFQVLHNHAPLVAVLGIGKVKVEPDSGSEVLYAISGGIFEVNNNKATILAESIESKEEIDKERARRAKQRAEDLLKSSEKGIDKEELRETIRKAENRIKL